MTSHSIPSTLRDLLSKLEFLAMIERGCKPCMGDMTFVDGSSWFGACLRAWKGEGKKGLLLYLNQVVDQTIDSIEEYKDTEFLPIVIHALAKAKIGISNLISTYRKNPAFVAEVRVCLENIKLQLEKNKQYLEGQETFYSRAWEEEYGEGGIFGTDSRRLRSAGRENVEEEDSFRTNSLREVGGDSIQIYSRREDGGDSFRTNPSPCSDVLEGEGSKLLQEDL